VVVVEIFYAYSLLHVTSGKTVRSRYYVYINVVYVHRFVGMIVKQQGSSFLKGVFTKYSLTVLCFVAVFVVITVHYCALPSDVDCV